ncbi:FKBP-type peptidyl-prolyl cis-trans isomerase [Natronospira proteinivora]|uniref:Peptidyl-prolyl cis-trans isomerase n=1 Tax=Natronospira proteinivora TaxID=1807133 RepID=A0ABT1GBE9_9GAMM|nr:FKBP-type peptidyl-prolyl cis-trans isomerase [Natronospira proteinivora]MCP1728640.1 FKBP-type peptidyl-prolyl cis-trans isomerase [Natronospira proteinivora]
MMRSFLLGCLLCFALLSLMACSADEGNDAEPEALPAPDNVSAPPETAEQSDSGLAWIVLEPGYGDVHPRPEDRVVVHYSGWTTDGEMFDSSRLRGEPAEFPLGQLIEGWVEGIQLMTEGEQRRFWIPGELAYDERPDRPDAPKGMLVFDVELIEILED